MKNPTLWLTTIMLVSTAATARGQRQEVGLTLGRLLSRDDAFPGGAVNSEAGTALQANYALRLWSGGRAALYFETHFLANPQRKVSSPVSSAPADYATLYITPGARVKFAPGARIAPWVAAGGGYAQYENSELDLGGRPNSASRREHHGAFAFGGGVDVRLLRRVALRGEIRDFYVNGPSYGVAGAPASKHNLVIGGGFVLRFGQ